MVSERLIKKSIDVEILKKLKNIGSQVTSAEILSRTTPHPTVVEGVLGWEGKFPAWIWADQISSRLAQRVRKNTGRQIASFLMRAQRDNEKRRTRCISFSSLPLPTERALRAIKETHRIVENCCGLPRPVYGLS